MGKASNTARGNRFENKIVTFLGELGWRVEKAHPRYFFIGPGVIRKKSHDLFGAFDLMAFHPMLPNVALIQCSIDENKAAIKKRTIDESIGQVAGTWPHYVQVWLKDEGSRNRIIVWDRSHRNASWVETSFRIEPGCWPNAVLGLPPPGFSGLLALQSTTTTSA